MMKRFLAILPIFLLVTVLAGCSSDDSQEEYDGEIVVRSTNGKRVLVKETDSYPDSTYMMGDLKVFKVPCVPIKKTDMPKWMYDQLFKVMGVTASTGLYQGELVGTGDNVYVMQNSASPSGFVYDKSGTTISQPLSIDNEAKNWRCIFIVEPHNLD